MAESPNHGHTALLDQLQAEVNRVLECTARVFGATNKESKTPALAHISRLKRMLPESTSNFHDALDQLEDELHLARLVLRRDLALCRTRNAQATTTKAMANTESVSENGIPSRADEAAATAASGESEVPQTEAVDIADVEMDDAPAKPLDPPPAAVSESVELPQQAADTSNTALHLDTGANPTQEDQDRKPGGEDEARDRDPDTANMSVANDLESLFGPTSADPGGAGGPGDEFNIHLVKPGDDDDHGAGNGGATNDDEDDDMFDFGLNPQVAPPPASDGEAASDRGATGGDGGTAATAAPNPNLHNNPSPNLDAIPNAEDDDGTNIEHFLPGLQDYANTQPSAEGGDGNSGEGGGDLSAELDDLFADIPSSGRQDQKDGSQQEQQQGGGDAAGNEERDTTFDDLLDFAAFNASDLGQSQNGGGTQDNFDFDFT